MNPNTNTEAETTTTNESQPTALTRYRKGGWELGEFWLTKEEVLTKMDEGRWVFSGNQMMDSNTVSETDFTTIGKLVIVPALTGGPGKVRGRGRRRRRPVSQRWIRLQRLFSRNRPDWGSPRGEFP